MFKTAICHLFVRLNLASHAVVFRGLVLLPPASCLFGMFVLLLLLCNLVVRNLSVQVTSFSIRNYNAPL